MNLYALPSGKEWIFMHYPLARNEFHNYTLPTATLYSVFFFLKATSKLLIQLPGQPLIKYQPNSYSGVSNKFI